MIDSFNTGDWMMFSMTLVFIGVWCLILLTVRKFYFKKERVEKAERIILTVTEREILEKIIQMEDAKIDVLQYKDWLLTSKNEDKQTAYSAYVLRLIRDILKDMELKITKS